MNSLISLLYASCHNRDSLSVDYYYNTFYILSSESSAPPRSQGQTGSQLLANLPPCKKTCDGYFCIIEEGIPPPAGTSCQVNLSDSSGHVVCDHLITIFNVSPAYYQLHSGIY